MGRTMKKLAIVFLCLLLPGCVWWAGGDQKRIYGSGIIIKQERSIRDIHSVDISGMGTVVLSQGDTESLEIETDDNLMQYIISDVDGHTLKIKIDDKVRIQPSSTIVYYLAVKKIKKIVLQGAVKVKAGKIETDELSFQMFGSSRIDATIDVKELEVESSGSTKCNLQGNAEKQKIKISGSGFYNAGKLLSKECDIDVSGAARIMVNVTDDLKVDASGVAFIGYKGDPNVRKKSAGATTIQKVG